MRIATERLKAAGKAIILFHDTKTQTAAMLPAFPRYSAQQWISRGSGDTG
jgi:hypothetical protein